MATQREREISASICLYSLYTWLLLIIGLHAQIVTDLYFNH